MKMTAFFAGLCAALIGSVALGQELTRTNHYVPVVSTVPSMQGQTGLL